MFNAYHGLVNKIKVTWVTFKFNLKKIRVSWCKGYSIGHHVSTYEKHQRFFYST